MSYLTTSWRIVSGYPPYPAIRISVSTPIPNHHKFKYGALLPILIALHSVHWIWITTTCEFLSRHITITFGQLLASKLRHQRHVLWNLSASFKLLMTFHLDIQDEQAHRQAAVFNVPIEVFRISYKNYIFLYLQSATELMLWQALNSSLYTELARQYRTDSNIILRVRNITEILRLSSA